MNVSQTQYAIPEPLTRAGATLRGRNRADCPRCQKKRTVSHTHELFNCHEATCDFRGNVVTLAKELGLLKPLSPREAEELRRTRERARAAAEELSYRLRERRLTLQEEHRQLLTIYHAAVDRLNRNRQDEIGWSLLAHFYKQIPAVRAALTLLEDAPLPERIRYLDASQAKQRERVYEVVAARVLEDAQGRFAEVGF